MLPVACIDDLDSREGLLSRLRLVDAEGWDSPAGEDLLRYVREKVVRPQVARSGLGPGRFEQAESSAWQLCWRKLSDERLRESRNPWGVLWVAARRAVRDEVLENRHQTAAHRARRLLSDAADDPALAARGCPPVSLQLLADSGVEPVSPPGGSEPLGPALEAIVNACGRAGWRPSEAHRVVAAIAHAVRPRTEGSVPAAPWKQVAGQTGSDPAMVRRLTLVLLGHGDQPGLVARVHREGLAVLDEVRVQDSLRHTTCPGRQPRIEVGAPAMAL